MNTLKSTLLHLLALIASGFYLTQAQEQTTEANLLKPNAWALQFGIFSNFTLSSFQGGTISAKYQSSPQMRGVPESPSTEAPRTIRVCNHQFKTTLLLT